MEVVPVPEPKTGAIPLVIGVIAAIVLQRCRHRGTTEGYSIDSGEKVTSE